MTFQKHKQKKARSRQLLHALLAAALVVSTVFVPGIAPRAAAETTLESLVNTATPASATPAETLIIDNGDPGYAESPSWGSSSIKGYNGTSTRSTGGIGYSASWMPSAGTLTGAYTVSVYKIRRNTTPASDDPQIKVDIVHGGTTDTRSLDATQGTSGWVELGTFTFDGSGTEGVKMTKTTTLPGIFVNADAVKFERSTAVASDATLSSLTLSGAALSPAFSPATLDYAAEVDNQIDAVRVLAVTTDPAATLKVNGQAVPSGQNSAAVTLAVGVNDIPIEVTGASGADTRTYYIHVTRKTTNSVVIDYADSGYSESGDWFASGTVRGYNNSGTRYTTSVGASVTWKPNISAGTASVSFYKVNWPASADPNLKVEIAHDGIVDTRTIDLTAAGEGWIDLGTYAFSGSGNEYVKATRVTSAGTTVYSRVDAVKFEGSIVRKPDPPGPVRSRSLPNLSFTEKGTIENDSYKAVFFEAVWDGGRTYVRDLYHKENGAWTLLNDVNERLEEQWVVLSGDSADRAHYYSTMDTDWITFDGFSMPDERTVVLTDTLHADRFALSVTWSLADDNGAGSGRPTASYAFTPVATGHYVVGYQSFTAENLSDVSEVLSGARNHAKMVGTVESTGLWQLTSPMSLVEKKLASGEALTYGVYVPAEGLPLQFEPTGTDGNQRLGMSLINNEGAVQPIVYAPQFGTYSKLTGGSTYSFKLAMYAQKGAVYDAYADILRTDYAYTDYRENVEQGSLNDAMYNMIDLMKIEPQGDDSVDFVPSPSGWWNRAKGFVDIENQDSVRTAASSVMLGAYYLTGDEQLYESRALPMLEYGVSRNERGWSPKQAPVYGDSSLWKMAAVPFDVSTISTLYEMTGGRNAGLYALGQEEYRFRNPEPYKRGPVIQPLMMYRMTGDAAYLDEAKAAADAYIAEEIDTPSTANPDRGEFFYNYGKLWVEILELYEETKDPKYLNAAYKEGKRYASMFVARPVPEGTTEIPQPSPFRYELAFRWSEADRYDYPRDRLPEDEPGASRQVDSWIVSPNGMVFEAGSTSAAYRMNAQEAPFMLRLGQYTGDELLKDIAHNAVIGRYTNYPGYYYRGLIASQLEQDFPLQGPSEGTSIYYHHMPAQLGQTMDYLVTEQTAKSDGQITFPSVFETDFLWFKYHVYGSEAGSFYGHPNVWLWMPKGIVDPGNKQLNWISGESGDRFYVSLSNESHSEQTASVALDAGMVGFDPSRTYDVTVIRDNGAPEQTAMVGGRIETTVSAQGITALIVEGVDVDVPLHQAQAAPARDTDDKSYFFDTYSPIDAVKGMLLVRPDAASYDAYIQAKTTDPATLHYSLDGGLSYQTQPDAIYPMEWSIQVDDPSKPFTYYVESKGKRTQTRTLYVPSETSTPPPPDEPPAQRAFVIVDNVDAETEGGWTRATAANDYYYDNYITAKSVPGAPTSRIRWKPELPDSGLYKVYYKLPVGRADWSSDATFTVHDDGGSQTYAVNQQTSDGSWVLLGTHSFTAGQRGDVELTNKASGGTVAADAVLWVPDDYEATIDEVKLTADRSVLMRTQSAQLQTTLRWDTGVTETVGGDDVEYTVDRPDLVEIDASGKISLVALDGMTDQVVITAQVMRGGTVLGTAALTLPIRKLSVVVDSADAERYSETGPWLQSGLYGYDLNVKSRYTGSQGATATWKPTIPSGRFTVSFYKIVRMPGGDPNVQVEISHGGTISTATVDATSGASGWTTLGTYDFTGDGTEYVRLTRLTASSHTPDFEVYTRADAVKFEEFEQTTGVSVSPAALLLNPNTNATGQLTATVTPAHATDPSVLWSSSDPQVATVDADGIVTAAGDGNATITAETVDGGFQASSQVVVDGAAPQISLDAPLSFSQLASWTGSVVATDAVSGIAGTLLELDGARVERLEAKPLDLRVGTHRVLVSATDAAGNRAEQTYDLEVTIDGNGLKQAIELGWELGHIDNKGIYKSLLAKWSRGQPQLTALRSEVSAQSGKHIQAAFAALLVEDIDALIG